MPSVPASKREALAAEWLELTLHTYPEQSVQFIRRVKDPFRNPMGHALEEGLPQLIDELFGKMDAARITRVLEEIVRIRAVQNFSAAEAVGFVFLLKPALRREFANGGSDAPTLEERLDRMALLAFDIFMRCREKIYELQAAEGKRRMAMLERMYPQAEGW